MTPNLLLVEDDPAISAGITAALDRARLGVHTCATGAEAVAAAQDRQWDLVLLDLGLPDADGIDVCRAVRAQQPAATIVILTARDTELDVVVGLESGADDYLVKPIRTAELIARLRAHLRRPRYGMSSTVRRVGHLQVDMSTRLAVLDSTSVPLRAKQFDLLARLVAQAGDAISRETLMADVWDENWFGSTKTLDVHIAGLRRVLSDAAEISGVRAPSIATLRGFGYRIDV